MKFNSIKFKISVLYTGILGVILIAYSSILFFSLQYTLYHDLDDELRTKVSQVSEMINSYLDIIGDDQQSFIFAAKRAIGLKGTHPHQKKIKELEQQWLLKVDLTNDYVAIFDSKGKMIATSGRLQNKLPLTWDKRENFINIKFKNRKLRVITKTFSYKEKKEYIVQVATSIKPIIYILQDKIYTIIISIPIALLVIGFIGWLIAIRILSPAEEIAKTARRITYHDLSARVRTKGLDKEMRVLVEAFNDMISRLEESFSYIVEFSANVAHELKTPLAIIRGESEVTLRKKRSLKEYQRVIKVNLEEVERMIKTIDDLLLLAKLDYQPDIFKFEQFDLIPFFKEIYEQSKILASPKNITVSIDMPEESININADKVHLRRLFFNLIHNAVKFNSSDGKIDITVKTDDKNAVVSVRDTGIGIAEEDLPKVFNKFFHVDRTNHDVEHGNGLGLSIAQAIAKIHQGKIEVKSQPEQGSTFIVTLPIS